ncbi:MAG: hypothetical protein J5755_01570 [Clostridia bacterium]|nr:hypothetical protein [Clostridia bacterium]
MIDEEVICVQLEGLMAKWKGSAFYRWLHTPRAPLIVALVVASVAVLLYLALGGVSCSAKTSTSTAKGSSQTSLENSLSAILSEIDGAGETHVLITTDSKGDLVGVIVVSQGAGDNQVVVKLMRAVSTATGATPDQIDIFERK